MLWILLSLLSGFFLGMYDIAKKASVRDNAVAPILLASVITAACIWLPVVLLAHAPWDILPSGMRQLAQLTWLEHLSLAGKSLLVGVSWTAAFFALKRLPISIAAPIRATSPLWTVTAAVWWMGERPTPVQWLGMIAVLASFTALSQVGRREGLYFHRDRGIYLMMVATILGASSALYDKYLLQIAGISPSAVQAWFSIYLVPVMLPLAILWYVRDRQNHPFQWRWSIPAIAVLLLAADYAYFTAIAQPGALIAVISPVRRTSVVVAFLFGVWKLQEQNWQPKALCIATLLIGVVLMSL